jgi:trans-aconitate 2-methyltransferase
MKLETVKEFYDGYVEKLTRQTNRHEYVFKSIDKYIPHGRVLDLGCGSGITSRYLAKSGRDVVAVDVSPKLIEHAKNINSHFGRVEYVVDDICRCVWPEPFDSILMVDVLEHILPESIDGLFATLKLNSHENTVIYLNIPSAEVLRWLQENRPDLVQIVDNPVKVEKILSLFNDIGFVPLYTQLYWSHYYEYVFITENNLNEQFKGAF